MKQVFNPVQLVWSPTTSPHDLDAHACLNNTDPTSVRTVHACTLQNFSSVVDIYIHFAISPAWQSCQINFFRNGCETHEDQVLYIQYVQGRSQQEG